MSIYFAFGNNPGLMDICHLFERYFGLRVAATPIAIYMYMVLSLVICILFSLLHFVTLCKEHSERLSIAVINDTYT